MSVISFCQLSFSLHWWLIQLTTLSIILTTFGFWWKMSFYSFITVSY